jgi:hypothetical protein
MTVRPGLPAGSRPAPFHRCLGPAAPPQPYPLPSPSTPVSPSRGLHRPACDAAKHAFFPARPAGTKHTKARSRRHGGTWPGATRDRARANRIEQPETFTACDPRANPPVPPHGKLAAPPRPVEVASASCSRPTPSGAAPASRTAPSNGRSRRAERRRREPRP